MSGNINSKLTNKNLLKNAGICFVIFIICFSLSPNNGDTNFFIAFFGLFSFLGLFGILFFIILRLIKNLIFLNNRTNVINQPSNDDISADHAIVDFSVPAKLAKSSPTKILKAKVKKSIKADSKIEKKHNPVRSISYTPPTLEEEIEKKAKERDQYLKKNFDSKLKTLWRGSKDIEFSYSDANDDISYRNVELNKASINQYGEIYFYGICEKSGENRTFKVERIISTIEYDREDYTVKQFMTNILQINNNSKKSKQKIKKETFDIHFTGFKQTDEERLIKLARAKDLTVRKSVTQNLQILCIGYNASLNKIEQAKNNSIPVMTEKEFLHFLETGEISKSYV